MSVAARWILAIEPAGGWTAAHERAFVAWARATADAPGVLGAEMETIEADAHAAHTGRDEFPTVVALLSLWAVGPDVAAAAQASARESGVSRVKVFPVAQCTVRHPFPRDWADGEPTPGLKKSTFWQANPAVGASWQQRYANHAGVVRGHHSSAWQYRQNLLAPHDDAAGWDAVSELWWPTPAGLIEHFYNSPESQLAVRDDTVFVGKAMPIVTTHTILRTPPMGDTGAAQVGTVQS